MGNVAVADGSLTQAIWTVRRVLRDDGATPRIVQNVRGRGYRFMAPVEQASERAPDAMPRPARRRRARSGEQLNDSGRAVEFALLGRAADDALAVGDAPH